MIEFIDMTLAFCVALGFALGIISGLTPGLHLNNFASMLLAISPQLLLLGLTPFQMASIILAASISQTFFDAIPAIFLGAPDSETALSVLPGQRLMLEGGGLRRFASRPWEARARSPSPFSWSIPYPGSSPATTTTWSSMWAFSSWPSP